ncbi:MAG: tRNA (N6-isopentenyl adenosine(37)-C2)-methylthiotransferase MiaB [Bacteriovoracaceae bacterium]|nr:tRNA (N6-isopentenyl adenosine(37)-C2)-methylthiotransferase MiaB [Halobacteriovoraceae bacterium]MDP7320314.1 tRNA (N6-isopentenyl adenosine(37)-C2)-methylthiotransferase MiaB [Bacteriovoracaceae bacterium]
MEQINYEEIKTLENGSKLVGDLEFPKRKVWVKTYGCQMNYHDTERILSHLEPLNFSLTSRQEEADLLLFNTCAIRDLANQKFYSHLGNTKHQKKQKEVKVAAGGCIAQTESKELLKKYPQLDFAFGTDVVDNIGEMVYRAYAGDKKFAVTSWDRADNYSIQTKITHGSPQAFVNIIKGCDKFCSYCIVPFTRGREKSRSVAEIVNDVARLVQYQGIQEVTLLGQNVNSFGKKNGESLAQLIMELEKITGLEIIRYTTSHPYDISDELIEVHGKSKKLANHLHLPVQSGSNTVLQRMLRQYSIEHYLERLDALRKANPHIVLSTDIIAGFPNETQQEHEATLELLDKAQYDFIYSYNYSARKGTKASRMRDILTKEIRGRRLREIQAHQLKIQEKVRASMVGKTYRVLVEGKGTMKGEVKWKGRTNCFRIVHFRPETLDQDYLWHWVDLKITSATALSCQGEIIRDYGKRVTPIQ